MNNNTDIVDIDLEKHSMYWQFPIPRPHCGVPLANGNIGVLLAGEDDLRLTVNRVDFWDRRNASSMGAKPSYQEAKKIYDPNDHRKLNNLFAHNSKPWYDDMIPSTLIPGGRFDFSFKSGWKPQTAKLDFYSGEVIIHVTQIEKTKNENNTAIIYVILDVGQDLLLVDDPENIIKCVTAKPSWDWLGKRFCADGYTQSKKINNDNITGWFQSTPEDSGLLALCEKRNLSYAITLSLHDAFSQSIVTEAQGITSSCTFKDILVTNRKWFSEYWARSPKVNIPDDFLQKFHYLALYKFACVTNPRGVLPAGLQGVWLEEYKFPQWSGDYHFNVNAQEVYSFAFPSGHPEHLLPLFDMLDNCLEEFKTNAKLLLGIDDGLYMPHALNDKGKICGGVNTMACLDPAITGWVALLYWNYYRYTADKEFLRERAFPFMHGIMKTCEAMLDYDDGEFILPLAISAEYAQPLENNVGLNPHEENSGRWQNAGVNPSCQLACIHMLANSLIEACKILEIQPENQWLEIKQKLPSYTSAGVEGHKRIALWEGQDLEISHRHPSHLAGIYPFDTLNNSENIELIHNTIEHWLCIGMSDWSEWSIPLAAMIQARTDHAESPIELLKLWRKLYVNEGWATVYAPRFKGIFVHALKWMGSPEKNEIMQIDGTMGAVTALYEMLIHMRGDELHLFSGIAYEWQNVSFENIHLPGPMLVSAKRENNIVVRVQIKALEDVSFALYINNTSEMRCVNVENDVQKSYKLPCTLHIAKGETIILSEK